MRQICFGWLWQAHEYHIDIHWHYITLLFWCVALLPAMSVLCCSSYSVHAFLQWGGLDRAWLLLISAVLIDFGQQRIKKVKCKWMIMWANLLSDPHHFILHYTSLCCCFWRISIKALNLIPHVTCLRARGPEGGALAKACWIMLDWKRGRISFRLILNVPIYYEFNGLGIRSRHWKATCTRDSFILTMFLLKSSQSASSHQQPHGKHSKRMEATSNHIQQDPPGNHPMQHHKSV
jgi:hypothetical protein